jgi:tripartite-type tricarboxylate transporter receptor subunit TctC
MGRMTGQKLGELLGVQVVVDNRAGANGNIAGEIVARSSPDGYTLIMGANGVIAVNPSLYRKMPFDPQKDLAPISLVGTGPLLMVVHPTLAAQTVADFIGLAKAKPNGINYASSGSGSTAHLSSELLKSMAKIEIVHVPYKGAGPALNDVIGGQVQMLITGVSAALPHVRSGKLRALGVTSAKRIAAIPEVAPIGDTVRGYEVLTWYGVLAPAATPQAVLKRLHDAVIAGIGAKDVHARMSALGVDPATSTPAQFAALIREEMAKWAQVVRVAGIRPE